jgi:hypothetical protein
MVVQEGIMEQPNIVGRWSEALEALHGRIAHRFARSEARERVRRYLLWGCSDGSSARTAGSLRRRSERRIRRASKGCSTLRSGTPPWCAMICAST